MENEKFKYWWLLLIKGIVAIAFSIYIIVAADKFMSDEAASIFNRLANLDGIIFYPFY